MAPVVADAASVLPGSSTEAQGRDLDHTRTTVALVDGNNHQIDIRTEARRRPGRIRMVRHLLGKAICLDTDLGDYHR